MHPLPLPDSFWDGITPGGRLIIALVLILAVVVVQGFRVIAARIATTTAEASQARQEAATAAVRSLPTANGFAAGTTRQLDRIEENQGLIRAETAAIRAETAAQLADVRQRLGRLEAPTTTTRETT